MNSRDLHASASTTAQRLMFLIACAGLIFVGLAWGGWAFVTATAIAFFSFAVGFDIRDKKKDQP